MPQSASAVDLRSFDHYIASCIHIAREKLSNFSCLAEILEHQGEINRYPRLESLGEPRQLKVLEEETLALVPQDRAKAAVARGEVLFEHAAAGEGTRLMLGPKYFLNLSRDLTVDGVAHLMSLEAGKIVSAREVGARLEMAPHEILPLALGTRHMLQQAFDLEQLAGELGGNPRELRHRQHLLMIIGEDMLAHLEKEFYQWHFYGFNPAQVFFMVQKSFHGLSYNNLHGFFYDEASPRRLHNHGQAVMQQTMEGQVFTLTGARPWEKRYYPRAAMEDWLQGFLDKISYNIEDLDYLQCSLDYATLGLALTWGDEGYGMVMEVVANNPAKPQKGGMLAWDGELGRDVMIESFQLGDLPEGNIHYLNRNFNHYPRPYQSWARVGEAGLPMPIAVKEGYLYYQPVQGDINFLVPTAFFRRRQVKPIQNLKSPATLLLALNRMGAQDRQPGFKEFVQRCWQGKL
jgi:hypothetical protein